MNRSPRRCVGARVSAQAKIALVVAFLMGVGLAGCTRADRLDEPDRPLSEYGAFPADDDFADNRALQVTMHRPKTELTTQSVISVAFNKPMVEPSIAERPVDKPIFEISPALEGDFSWIGARTAVFHPSEPFSPATEYSVRVPAEIKSLDGSELGQDFSFNFYTPYLDVRIETSRARFRPGDTLRFSTTLPVELTELKKAVSLRLGDREIPVDIQVLEPTSSDKNRIGFFNHSNNIDINNIDTKKEENTEKTASVFELKPRGGFKLASTYELHIDGSLRAPGAAASFARGIARKRVSAGPREGRVLWPTYRDDGLHLQLKTYGDFRVEKAECGWDNQCSPSSSWQVKFSNPIDKESAEKCARFSPALQYKHSIYDDKLNLHPQNMVQGQTYKVVLSDDCRDIFGNRLVNPRTFSARVDYRAPSVQVTTGIKTVEKRADKTMPGLPMRVENLTQPASARYYQVPADKVGWLAALLSEYDNADGRDPLSPSALKAALGDPLDSSTGGDLRGSFGGELRRSFGGELRRGQSKIYSLELSKVLKKPQGAVFFDISAPDLVNDWSDGHFRTLVAVSDLGLNIQQSSNKTLVWVTKLSSGLPAAGAKIVFLGSGAEELWRGETDKTGLANAPSYEQLSAQSTHESGSNTPIIATASLGDDTNVLELSAWRNQVHPYQFGLPYDSADGRPELRTFIFTERGVYRPGEKVHIKGFARLLVDGELQDYPHEHLVLSVHDSRDKLVRSERLKLSKFGGFELDLDLPDQAPLGTWDVLAKSDGQSGSSADAQIRYSYDSRASFRVEAFRAPEFEVNIDPEKDEYQVGESAKIDIQGLYLFGAPMQNGELNWVAERQQSSFNAAKFSDFSFQPDSPNYWYYDASTSHTLGEDSGQLDAQGASLLNLKIPKNKDFKGPQRLQIEASVSDLSNQEVSARTSIKIHPGEFYVGVEQPDYLVETGSTIKPRAIAVDHQGESLTGKKMTMRVIHREWKNELKKDASGYESWETTPVDTPAGSCQLTSKSTPVSCEFKVERTGSYRVIVQARDTKGHELESADSFYVWGSGPAAWGMNNEQRIELVSDKERYQVGDTARIMVQSPFERAQALVTVEKGKILEQYTTKIVGNSQTVEVPITAEMKPNAFVSVSLIRGREDNDKSSKNKTTESGNSLDPGRPQFKIGYAQLTVDHNDKTLNIELKTDKKDYRPGAHVQTDIQLTDHRGRPTSGEITLMAVDQGVLSLTGYQTPSPGEYFYATQPITTQHLDTRLGLTTHRDLEAQASGMKSDFGGGGGGATNYRNEFAAAATFQGLIQVGEDGKAHVDFKLPDNLSAYRVMAVAVAGEQRFGHAETRIQVNKPLMIRPALPRFAATGDTFKARAIIQSMKDVAGEVEVEISVEGALELVGSATQTLTLKKGANQEAAFDIKASDPGEATVRFRARAARGADAEDSVEITLPVHYPAARQSYLEAGILTEKSGWGSPKLERRIDLPEAMHPNVGGMEITLSSSQIAELLPGLQFLLDYPYTCSEQIASRSLPFIALEEIVAALDIPGYDAKTLHQIAQSTIDQLLSRQIYSGGITYWPGEANEHEWVSVYTAWMLSQAKHKNRADASTPGNSTPGNSTSYKIDSEREDKLMDRLRDLLRAPLPQKLTQIPAALATRAFAVWTLAEAGQAEPAYHEDLYQRRRQMSPGAQLMLAAAMHQAESTPEYRDQILDDMLEKLDIDPTGDGAGAAWLPQEKPAPGTWRIWESATRQNAVALLALMRIRPDDPHVPQLAQGLLRQRRHGYWSTTQDTAFALSALGEYFALSKEAEPDYEVIVALGQDIIARETFKKLEITPRTVQIPMETLTKYRGQLLTIMRSGDGGPAYYSARLNHVPSDPPETGFDGGFYIQREYFMTEGPDAGKPVESVKPGQVVRVQLSITVPEDAHYLAIEDPLPAGFEPINADFETTSQTLVQRELSERFFSADNWFYYHLLSFDYEAQHDDRVELFKSDVPAGIYRHAYLMRATTPGTFKAPAARVEAMYDPVVFGRSDAKTTQIAP